MEPIVPTWTRRAERPGVLALEVRLPRPSAWLAQQINAKLDRS